MTKRFKHFTRAIILNENKEFLLIENSKNKNISPGIAMFPGGTVEYGEGVEETLVREIKEEVDLDILSCDLLMVQTMVLQETHWLGVYYICKTKNLDFKNMEPQKHTRVFWGKRENLDNYGIEVYKLLLETRSY